MEALTIREKGIYIYSTGERKKGLIWTWRAPVGERLYSKVRWALTHSGATPSWALQELWLTGDVKIHTWRSPQGHPSNKIPPDKVVKKGCILVPLLFTYYSDSLVQHLRNSSFQLLVLADKMIPASLFAEDTIILPYSQVGLRGSHCAFTTYCKKEHLVINYQSLFQYKISSTVKVKIQIKMKGNVAGIN